ncbi:uncharacterized protein [Chironomus tepperi]|uniref:uncharacterized protein n=1 Tax=Chironomus tepperi TaxID=113505 RepID=UPI00391F10DF
MEIEKDILEKALDVSKKCLLPTLLEDFDKQPIDKTDFTRLGQIITENIHLFLDILLQSKLLDINDDSNKDIIQIQRNIILIYCEQCEQNMFSCCNDKGIETLKELVFKNIQKGTFNDAIFLELIDYYKKSLKSDKWKKEFGAVHGFPTFCQIMLELKSRLATKDLALFMLSVGSNLTYHYELFIKTLGLKVYKHILDFGRKDTLIKELNIHQAIYTETIPLIQRSNEDDLFNRYIYDCLYNIVIIDESLKTSSSKWSKYDDIMSKLLTHFGFVSDLEISKFLVYQIAKFCSIGMNLGELQDLDKLDMDDHQYFIKLKTESDASTRRPFRWTKAVMETVIRESTRFITKVDDSMFFLYTLNIISILIGPQTEEFNDITMKLIIILMKFLQVHKSEKRIADLVLCILKTIGSQSTDKNVINAVEKLCKHSVFL